MAERDMTITEAIELMKLGKWVARRRWNDGSRVTIQVSCGHSFFLRHRTKMDESCMMLCAEDVLTADWFVVEYRGGRTDD